MPGVDGWFATERGIKKGIGVNTNPFFCVLTDSGTEFVRISTFTLPLINNLRY